MSSALEGKVVNKVCQLIDRVVHAFQSSVDDVDPIVGGIFNEFFHVASETGEVGCDTGDSHHRAFGWRVSPGLVVRRENTQMRAADEVIIVQW